MKDLEWIDERTGCVVTILFLELSGYRFDRQRGNTGGDA